MKSEVYSWRVAPERKAALERAARQERLSLAELLDRIAAEWLASRSSGADDDADQRRVRAAARRFYGKGEAGVTDEASRVSELVRRKLRTRHGA